MKKIYLLCLCLITTGLALSQTTPVNIGTGADNRSGDPLRTWAAKYNQNDYLLGLSGTASGTNTYTVTISVPAPGFTTGITAPTAYVSNQRYFIKFTNANTGAATLNINSLGAKSIVKQGATALVANDIRANQVLELYYDGTNLQIVGDGGSLSGGYSFTASDFNESGQTVSIDYTNGQAATSGQKGFLTSADWTTFNAKQAAISLTTTGTSGAATFSSNTVNVPRYDTYADAKVADAINDGTTTIAPSQNAVYDADALKIDKLITVNRQTASYTLVLADAVKIVEMNSASANNLTVPPNSSVAFSIGTQIMVAQYGAGQTTFVQGSGVTIRSEGGKLKLTGQYAAGTLLKIGTDEWYLFGNLTN